MYVVEDSFGSDVEAFYLIPLSLVAIEPSSLFPSFSEAISMKWAASGVELGLAFLFTFSKLLVKDFLWGGSRPPLRMADS